MPASGVRRASVQRRAGGVTPGIGTPAASAAKVGGVNWTRFVVRASILGAIVGAIAVFFAVSVRRAPPPEPAAAVQGAEAR